MASFAQYQDLLGSEGPEYEFYNHDHDPTRCWYVGGSFPSIDPQLDFLPSHEAYMTSQHHITHAPQRASTAYNPIDHGFGRTPSQSLSMNGLSNTAFLPSQYEDPEQYRNVRYLSPTDPNGFALSSNESCYSEYALSPDALRNPYDSPLISLHVEPGRLPIKSSHEVMATWTPTTPLVPTMSMGSTSISQTPVRLRDFQVAPDPILDENPMEEVDNLQPNLNPEELELSEEVPSPVDSGIGLSPDDYRLAGDEYKDSRAHESDNESEFIPGRRRSPRKTTIKTHRIESTISLGDKGQQKSPVREVLGTPRVKKPVHNRKDSQTMSRSKVKKPSSKKRQPGTKSFPCTFHHYGCPATFASKNEWKRHVSSQHLQLGYFRCDLGSCSPTNTRNLHRGFNDFNRKDLFTQHCRRMHAPWSNSKRGEEGVSKKEKEKFESQLEVIRSRCWVDNRKAPEKSSCGFCGKIFVDTPEKKAWEDRMEHVGRHFERDGSNPEQEEVDDGLKQWAIQEGLIHKRKGAYMLASLDPSINGKASGINRRSKRVITVKDLDDEDKASDEEDNDEDSMIDEEVEAAVEDDTPSDEDAEAETEDEDAEAEDE